MTQDSTLVSTEQVIHAAQQRLQQQDTQGAISLLAACKDKHIEQYSEYWQINGLARLLNNDIEDSLFFLAKSAAMKPNDARYHSNYGEALRRHGDTKKAYQHLLKAVKKQPNYSPAIYNLACTELSLKRFKTAIKRLYKLLKDYPKQAHLHLGLADAFRQSGQTQKAIHHYQKTLELNPEYTAALSNLGWLLLTIGRLDEALEHSRRAVEINPKDVDALFHLGRCLTELEHFDEAMDAFADAYELNPKHVDLLNGIAGNWLKVSDIKQADHWYHLALQQDPANIKAQCGHAQVLLEAGLQDDALTAINQVIDKDPENNEALLTRAKIYMEQVNMSACFADYETIITSNDGAARIHAAYGHALEAGGNLEVAREQFEIAIEKNARCIPALSGLAVTQKKKLKPQHAETMQSLLQQSSIREGAQAQLHTGLGYFYDGMGDYVKAAQHIQSANQYKLSYNEKTQKAYDPNKYRQYIDRVIETFDGDYFKRLTATGSDSEQPVFIIGMPRSGTTLTEQIFNAHPHIIGIGEQPLIGQSFNQLPAAANHPGGSPFDLVQHITKNGLKNMAKGHLQQIKKLIGDAKNILRVVDKMPDNYSKIGWILTLFPNAKIIHAKRDLRDVAVSCWMTQFSKINWAFDLNHIAERMIQYDRVMQHWYQVVPDRIIVTEYEQLVADPEFHSRRLIAALGLDWHADCLDFHRQKNVVRTASVTQVRQPIYQKSVNRWQRYEKPLAPIFNRLEQAGLLNKT
ncbi:tetratricopeptide repeat-containing sulfotransferase family protein [Marinicella gelatinilytica]|uniref:tetratricopeptide repeat-containing sulfotransferase family protein n=1 Tax=Marinicella gelatinilytica TaxID=2996017 RepID=UPI002260C123|nr:tetratricopeptide repeat-containing sulfotransferase family protein [Marinicella gelatinilytica]MCX7545029.1 sulfotransferase [Marinicella gelatinilytica]